METYSVICLDISVRYFSFFRPTIQLPWACLPLQPFWHISLTLLAATHSYQLHFLAPWPFSICSVYPWCSCVSLWSVDPDKIRSNVKYYSYSRTWTAQTFSSITDASNAAERLSEVFEAELLEKTHEVNEDLPVAIQVKGATFTWDTPPPDELDGKKKTTKKKVRFPSKDNTNVEAAAISADASSLEKTGQQAEEEDRVFQVRDISMEIPRGLLVAVVGPVGSGKTSLLQGLIGEMRKTSGSIIFGGSVGYCPQSAWIQVGASFFDSELLINYLYRMRLLGRIFVLVVLLSLRDTGRPSETRVWSLI